MPVVFRTLRIENITDGETKEVTWNADKDYVIKHILFKRSDSGQWTDSRTTIWIEGDTFTRDYVPVAILGSDVLNAFPLNIELKKGQQIKISFSNKEGTTISVDIVLVLEPKT